MTVRVSFLALLVGCTGDNLSSNNTNKDEGFEEEADESAPLIEHEPIDGTQTFGVDVPIEAVVTDEGTGVLFVYLHYKNEVDGEADWTRLLLVATEGVYSGKIKGSDMRGGGVDYYIEATDYAQNPAFAPEDGGDDPYHFRIAE